MASLALLTGCLSFFAGPKSDKSTSYVVTPPNVLLWNDIDPRSSDRVFKNVQDGATLSVTSVCNEYQDQSLEQLSKIQLTGIGETSAIETFETRVAGHPALMTQLTGKSDGKVYKLTLTVVRTQHCVFDLTLVSPLQGFNQNKVDYDALVHSFKDEISN